MTKSDEVSSQQVFTKYDTFIIAILSILQFTIILDFMVLNPLGAQLLTELSIKPAQFGLVVSAYAFSAGASGLLAAGFADKFDRKKLLLFFYAGFILGTAFCAMATSYESLLFARIFTGIFGGVIGSIVFAIITDLFRMEVRGRVMGFVQTAFAASQVLGIPIGLILANKYNWHAPFWLIVGFSLLVYAAIFVYLKPIDAHLKIKSERNAFEHLWKIVTSRPYQRAFLTAILLSTGGYMLMPLGSAFSINNLKIQMQDLPLIYGVTGIVSIIFGPIIGKLSDKIGKYQVFVGGSIMSMVTIAIFTQLGETPLWLAIIINALIFIAVSSRMISSSALFTAVPKPQDRGAFMSINASVQQISGGFASALAGMIVVQTPSGFLDNYDILGYVVIASMIITISLMYFLNRQIQNTGK
ncbi:MAG: MFS transporter [Saprospiraceae bacterium]|nr:MFS transporter [Saprospiraceae bacterium]